MIKNILERHKKSLFILPFISVVREKMFYLQVRFIFLCTFGNLYVKHGNNILNKLRDFVLNIKHQNYAQYFYCINT